ncbi:MAG: hypothetical protein WC048_02310 [Rhizobium sp.]
MPDHVINEVLLHDVKLNECTRFLIDRDGCLSFDVLVPLPLNLWAGDFNNEHRKAFPGIRGDAAREIWGTEWDAYGSKTVEDTVAGTRIRFQTAWDHPRGWLCALFNTLKCDITASWLCEGARIGHVENYKAQGAWGTPTWESAELADDRAEYLHLSELLYGEQVPDDADEGDFAADMDSDYRRDQPEIRPPEGRGPS